MYLLDYYQALGSALLLSIVALTLAALASRRARHYAAAHPARYAALAVLLAAANVMANKTPVPPEVKDAVRLRLMGLPGRVGIDDPELNKYRPLDFRIVTK